MKHCARITVPGCLAVSAAVPENVGAHLRDDCAADVLCRRAGKCRNVAAGRPLLRRSSSLARKMSEYICQLLALPTFHDRIDITFSGTTIRDTNGPCASHHATIKMIPTVIRLLPGRQVGRRPFRCRGVFDAGPKYVPLRHSVVPQFTILSTAWQNPKRFLRPRDSS